MQIFDGGYECQAVEGFTARRIPLPATLYDRLDWKASYTIAKEVIVRGERILWDLDLGLFSRLPLPLSDEGQFQACKLAVEYLLKEIREHFLEATLGVCLYRGSGDMRRGFPREPNVASAAEEASGYQHLVTCRDRCRDFLYRLVVNWPDTLPLFTTLDMRRLSLFTQMLLLHRERPAVFCPIVRGVSRVWQFPHLGWEEWAEAGTLSRQPLAKQAAPEHVQQGVLLPGEIEPSTYADWEAALMKIEQQGIVTRILTESCLTAEWDGLDRILISPQGVSASQTQRALQGFIAAGGEVVYLF